MDYGFKEYLIVTLVGLSIFLLPILLRHALRDEKPSHSATEKCGLFRMCIIFTGLWLFLTEHFFPIAEGLWVKFVIIGVVPSLLGWGIWWMMKVTKNDPERR